MLRASFSEEVGGRRVLFSLPLAGLRRVAAHRADLFDLARALAEHAVTLADVEAVLDAACGDPDAARHVIEECGLIGATERAARILLLALTDERPADAGN
jgi:hypothetical protein